MIKAVLMPEDFDSAIRQCSCAALFLIQLWSYAILSCSLFSFYKPDPAVLYGSQELPCLQFYTKYGNRLLLAAIFQDYLRKDEYLPQAALFQGFSTPLLSAPCQSDLSGRDTSLLYDVEKPASKLTLGESLT